MSRVVLDSDGLIKLLKAGILRVLVSSCECIIPEAIYEESVEEGKKELYEDAFILEDIVKEGIKRIEVDHEELDLEKIDEANLDIFGKGEKEVFRLYFQEEAEAVISDDRAFLNLLDKEEVKYFTPCNASYTMYEKDLINVDESIEGLDEIKGLVRDDVYERTIKKIKGGEQDGN